MRDYERDMAEYEAEVARYAREVEEQEKQVAALKAAAEAKKQAKEKAQAAEDGVNHEQVDLGTENDAFDIHKTPSIGGSICAMDRSSERGSKRCGSVSRAMSVRTGKTSVKTVTEAVEMKSQGLRFSRSFCAVERFFTEVYNITQNLLPSETVRWVSAGLFRNW